MLPRPTIRYQREHITLSDGDQVVWDWLRKNDPQTPRQLLALFHGLEGGSQSHYAKQLALACAQRGYDFVVCHFRACGGISNHKLQSYHSGDSAYVDFCLRHLATHYPEHARYAVGVSLGGNALSLWAGQQGSRAQGMVKAAAAVSGPLQLGISSEAIAHGLNKIYTHNFLSTMRVKAKEKAQRFPGQIDASQVAQSHTLAQFDDAFTAPVHGYTSACDYYERASARAHLKHIDIPFLLLNAKNDPFVPAHLFPKPAEVSSTVTCEQPDSGGHVGFVSGPFPGKIHWLPNRLLDFFAQQK
jgi:predicted alpha/beta-fold hydrolase